jgi:uncharacterized protein (AIM24 family)
MHVPEPIPTDLRDQSFAGIDYHVRGQLVPELQIELAGAPVMFEHHVLLWKEPGVDIEVKKLAKGVKRMIAGLDFFVTRATGPGRIAFSRDTPGQVIPIQLSQGQTLNVREHQFVAASDALEYTYERVQGARNMLLGGSGIFVDNFTAGAGDAIVWVHANGNAFEVVLDAGEQIDVEAGAWLYKDTTVTLESVGIGFKTSLLGGGGKFTWNRFTGPGRLAIQTMFVDPYEARQQDDQSGQGQAAVEGSVVGSVLGGLLRS